LLLLNGRSQIITVL